MTKPLLVVTHVPWEGPHRILDAFAGIAVVRRCALADGEPLPTHDELRGAIFMGGPMSANDAGAHPGLADEIAWIAEAVRAGLPLLGICLGSQLLARALGASVTRGPASEIGFHPVETFPAADEDPLLRMLAPRTTVLHWHGERFELPRDATALARSAETPLQAFRAGPAAWGLLFHPEGDAALVDAWLAEPSMHDELVAARGPDAPGELRNAAPTADPRRGDALFAAFAAICADQRRRSRPRRPR